MQGMIEKEKAKQMKKCWREKKLRLKLQLEYSTKPQIPTPDDDKLKQLQYIAKKY